MSILDNLKIPEEKTEPTHKAKIKTIFVSSSADGIPPLSDSVVSDLLINKDEKVILLEEGIGFEAKWAKIKKVDTANDFNSYGFTLVSSIEPSGSTLPSLAFSKDLTLQPVYTEKPLDWKELEANKVFDDKLNGKYIVHYDTGIQEFPNKETFLTDIKNEMKNAIISGSKIILEEFNKVNSTAEVQQLQNGHFLFASAESLFFPLRPCSTMRVLVTIPKRYIPGLKENAVLPFDGIKADIDLTKTFKPVDKPQEKVYETVIFKNYAEYTAFFKNIKDVLDAGDTLLNAQSYVWAIEPPSLQFDVKREKSVLEEYTKTIDNFIFSNLTEQNEAEVKRTEGIIFQETSWNGELSLTYNKQDLSLVLLSFKTPSDKQLALRNGVNSFLKNSFISNKTINNYIIQKSSNKQEFEKAAGELINLNTFGGSLSAISTVDLNNGFAEQLIDFFIKFHYPKINGIFLESLNLANCTREEADLIRDIYQKKFGNIAVQAANTLDAIDLEAQLAQTGIIENRNVRILLGQEKAGDTPYESLNRVIAAARLLDVERFIAEYHKNAASKISVQDYNRIMENAQKAKGFLNSLAFSSFCNPYITKKLKTLQTFQLPRIRTYNPQRNIANELSNLLVKIINEVIVISIRASFEQTIKQAIAGSAENFLADQQLTKEQQEQAETVASALNNFTNEVANDREIFEELQTEEQKSINESSTEASQNSTNISLKEFLEDVTCVLSLQELCKLFRGAPVSDTPTIDLLNSLLNTKYPNLRKKLVTRNDITDFFAKIGIKIDSAFCQSVEDLNPSFPLSPLCDDGTLEELRRQLLEDKGLTPELINELLNEAKDKEVKNFESLIKFLEGDPFDFSNLPSILCKKGPNGEIIPPSVDITQPLESFNKMMDSLMEIPYNSFDAEQEFWSGYTYSTKTDSSNLQLDKLGEISTSGQASANNTGAIKAPEILPSYIFVEDMNKVITDAFQPFERKLDGGKQQSLDADLIKNEFRQVFLNIEKELIDFISQFIARLEVYLPIQTIKEIQNLVLASSIPEFTNNTTFRESLLIILSSVTFMDKLQKIIQEIPEDATAEEIKLLFDGDNDKSATIIALEEMQKYKSDFENVIETIAVKQQGQDKSELLIDFEKIVKDYSEYKNIFDVYLKTVNNYPDFNISIKQQNTVKIAEETYETASIIIEKNSFNFIKKDVFTKIDDDVIKYIQEELKVQPEADGSFNKVKVYNTYINKINPDANATQFLDYSKLERTYYRSIATAISSSSSFLKVSAPPNTDNSSPVPFTKYLKLKLEQTPDQKICGVRPHYLDLDSIKQDASKNKESTFCLETIVNQNVLENKPFSSTELKSIETNDTEDIMLNAFHTGYIRMVLHDIILRSIAVFGTYDPQQIRDDNVLLEFIYQLLRYETKVLDETYYGMLKAFYLKKFKQQSKEQIPKEEEQQVIEKVLKDIIKKELSTVVLPKLAKRILDDTNKFIIENNLGSQINLIRLKENLSSLPSVKDIETSQELELSLEKIYIRGERLAKNVLLFEEGSQIIGSAEFKLMFDYLFPINRYITNFVIDNILSTMTRKTARDVFRGTKKEFIRVAKSIQSKGQLQVDLNNPQDVVNDEVDLSWYILLALVQTPLKIAKGFIEAVDPNISISSKVYAGVKALESKTSSTLIPITSAALTPLIPPNPLLAIPYLSLGLWYESNENGKTKQAEYIKDKILEVLEQPEQKIDCGNIKNTDLVPFDAQGLYSKIIEETEIATAESGLATDPAIAEQQSLKQSIQSELAYSLQLAIAVINDADDLRGNTFFERASEVVTALEAIKDNIFQYEGRDMVDSGFLKPVIDVMKEIINNRSGYGPSQYVTKFTEFRDTATVYSTI